MVCGWCLYQQRLLLLVLSCARSCFSSSSVVVVYWTRAMCMHTRPTNIMGVCLHESKSCDVCLSVAPRCNECLLRFIVG